MPQDTPAGALLQDLTLLVSVFSGRPRVSSFLMTTVQAGTTLKYMAALTAFKRRLEQAGVVWLDMSAEERDWCLADDLLELKDDPDSAPAVGGDLVSALSKLDPHCRLTISWKVFDGWRKEVPVRQAVCLPPEVVTAMGVLATVLGRPAVGGAIMLCFCGLLRARESLFLRGRDLIEGPRGFVVCLGRTKRGVEERVVVANPASVRWLRAYIALVCPKADDFVFPISYGTLLYWSKKLALLLGFPQAVTTHSFRRSGASELCRLGVPFADIALYGRWSSEKSAKEYIRRGEAELVKARPEYAELLRRCDVWNAIGPHGFLGAKRPAVVAQIERKRITLDLVLQLERVLRI